MNRWKWLFLGVTPIALLAAALIIWNQCLAGSLAAEGKTGLLGILVKLGADVNGICEGSRPLIRAVKAHQVATVSYLLGEKADVNVRDEELATPLMRAAEEKQTQIARQLIAARADVNAADQNGRTALRYAIRSGSSDLAALLLQAGAGVNTADNLGDTPLMQAAQTNNVELARLLLKNGADPMLQDKAGRTAFEFIRQSGDPALVPLLRNLYFVPVGQAPMDEINGLVSYYRARFGVEIHVLPAMAVESSDVDTARSQLIAEDVLDSMARKLSRLCHKQVGCSDRNYGAGHVSQ